MSSLKKIPLITEADLKGKKISSLADRPTTSSRYGDSDLTPEMLKKRFDAVPTLLKNKINAIVDILASPDASKYIALDEETGADNLYDFLALFGADNDRDMIANHIYAMYAGRADVELQKASLQDIVNDLVSWLGNIDDATIGHTDYDLVITSDEDFSQLLYPLYKNDDNLTRDEAVMLVDQDSAFNQPNALFYYPRVLVKGVVFRQMRGYDDVRLHIFQPSIRYIRFEDCRWETHWKVSGKNPRDVNAANYNLNSSYLPDSNGKPRATAFNRAPGNLHLTIEGIVVGVDNVQMAPTAPVVWGVGLRNVKSLRDCHVEYPEKYKLTPEGYRSFEVSCQFFDSAEGCSLSGYWDGFNVSNCKVNKIVKRCTNVSNLRSENVLTVDGENKVPVELVSCKNLVNIFGLFNQSDNVGVMATEADLLRMEQYADAVAERLSDEALEAANAFAIEKSDEAASYAVADAKAKYLPLHTRSSDDLGYGGVRLYGVDADNKQVMAHARTGYNKNEIAMRDGNGRLVARYSETKDDVDEFYAGWHKSTLMPRDYIDKKLIKLLAGYAPILNGKVDTNYLPSYVDDVIEGYYWLENGVGVFSEVWNIHDSIITPEKGKIYVDLNTNRTYRWSGSTYICVSIVPIITKHSFNDVDADFSASDIPHGSLVFVTKIHTISGTGYDADGERVRFNNGFSTEPGIFSIDTYGFGNCEIQGKITVGYPETSSDMVEETAVLRLDFDEYGRISLIASSKTLQGFGDIKFSLEAISIQL